MRHCFDFFAGCLQLNPNTVADFPYQTLSNIMFTKIIYKQPAKGTLQYHENHCHSCNSVELCYSLCLLQCVEGINQIRQRFADSFQNVCESFVITVHSLGSKLIFLLFLTNLIPFWSCSSLILKSSFNSQDSVQCDVCARKRIPVGHDGPIQVRTLRGMIAVTGRKIRLRLLWV